MVKKFRVLLVLTLLSVSSGLLALDSSIVIGVVNFATCVTESKYGKYEQEQLEKVRGQWNTILEETEKELKEISAKFEDQEYLDSLSPEAEEELKVKYKALNEDMMKYQNQLYQVLNQANYFFLQKMANSISKASEVVAKDKHLDMVMNKEACFYHKPNMEVTQLVISQMDKNFEVDSKNVSENEPQEPQKTEE